MKKTFAVVLLIFTLCSVFALSANVHMGIISGAGVSHSFGDYECGIDFETTFPFYAIGCGIYAEKNEDMTFKEGFRLYANYFAGGDLYLYRNILKGKNTDLKLGLDFFAGTETPLKNFSAVLKAGMMFDRRFSKTGVFYIVAGVPVLSLQYMKGFEKPLIRFPMYNWASVLTGIKAGLKFYI